MKKKLLFTIIMISFVLYKEQQIENVSPATTVAKEEDNIFSTITTSGNQTSRLEQFKLRNHADGSFLHTAYLLSYSNSNISSLTLKSLFQFRARE